MKTILQAPSISEMIRADFELVNIIPRTKAIEKIKVFKELNLNWFFSPTTTCGEPVIECWYKYLKKDDFEQDVEITEISWL